MADLFKESSIVKRLKNKNIIQVEKAFVSDKQLVIIMELCSGGELKDLI
jgi:serine/threonine protein kinase